MVQHKMRTLQAKKRIQVYPGKVFAPGMRGAEKKWPKFRQAKMSRAA